MGVRLTALVLDTHAVHWWSCEPHRLSSAAAAAIEAADDLAVAAISWYELAWLAARGRIDPGVPIATWLHSLAQDVSTIGITTAIATAAAALPEPFPRDPSDRLIYATAVELGCQLVTKDDRLRNHPHPRAVAVW